jgi:hypothetical protein
MREGRWVKGRWRSGSRARGCGGRATLIPLSRLRVGEQVRLEPMRMELYLRVRVWEVGRIAGGATVEIVD